GNDSIVVSSPEVNVNSIKTAGISDTSQDPEGSISWTAGEFVAHNKGPLWYVLVMGAAIIIGGIIWLLTRDKVSAGAIIVVALVMIIFGSKRPRDLNYRIDNEGLHIGEKSYPFDRFRSFAISQQGAFSSIVLFPLKRFAVMISAYFNPSDEQKIVAIISNYLPLEEKRRDIIDEMMWKIRF
ncbi:MAG: hypothetical protein ACREF7_02160, partial [Candidatus Saccharimonadales bacterium]